MDPPPLQRARLLESKKSDGEPPQYTSEHDQQQGAIEPLRRQPRKEQLLVLFNDKQNANLARKPAVIAPVHKRAAEARREGEKTVALLATLR